MAAKKEFKSLSARAVTLLKKKPYSLSELSKALKVSIEETGELVTFLGKTYTGIARIGQKVFIDKPHLLQTKPLQFSFKEKSGKFGLVSCTHFGSKYAQITHLHEFYNRCADEKVDVVFNCGDVTDGSGYVYRGQRFEMHLQGFTEQRDFVVDTYPKVGVPTMLISGNHDDSFAAGAGIDICQEIVKERKDMDYLGRYQAYVNLQKGKTRLLLHHGDGGCAYAASYKGQKYIETFTSETKPQVYALGHYHTFIQMFRRNIHFLQLGCFQAQTPWLTRKMLAPELGGWIVEYSLNSADQWSLATVRVSLVPFYKAIEDDYKHFI